MTARDATAVFAANLARLRAEQKLSLNQLGGMAWVSAACISKIEGRQSDPTLGTASMLALALGTDLAAMLTEGFTRGEESGSKNQAASDDLRL